MCWGQFQVKWVYSTNNRIFWTDFSWAEDLVSSVQGQRVVLVMWTFVHKALDWDPPTQTAEHCRMARKTTKSRSKIRKISTTEKKNPNTFLLWTETRKSLQLEAVIWHLSLHNSNLLMIENWLIAIHAKKIAFDFFKIIHLQCWQYNPCESPSDRKLAKYAFTW